MKDKILFENTYISSRSNGYTRAYWTKYFKTLISEDIIPPKKRKGYLEYGDIVPLYNYISTKYQRQVVICHYDYKRINKTETSFSRFITAWISTQRIDSKKMPTLTICMIPSLYNVNKAKELIYSWFFDTKKTKELIETIYKNQNNE